MQKKQQRATRYEKAQAKKRGAAHLGGPGRPDYKRGRTKGEVKNWKDPVHSGVVKKAKKQGVREIASSSGFTKPAIEEARKARIKLFNRGRKVT